MPRRARRTIDHVRRAARELATECRVLMDLPGPKLRTGALVPGPRVRKLRPRRDACGRVIEPVRAWLGETAPAAPDLAHVPVPATWAAALRPDDLVRFLDARDARRALRAREVTAGGALVEIRRTAYIATGMVLHHARGRCTVGELPAVEHR